MLIYAVSDFKGVLTREQDGGSLDLILKKGGRIPEPVLGMISNAVGAVLLL